MVNTIDLRRCFLLGLVVAIVISIGAACFGVDLNVRGTDVTNGANSWSSSDVYTGTTSYSNTSYVYLQTGTAGDVQVRLIAGNLSVDFYGVGRASYRAFGTGLSGYSTGTYTLTKIEVGPPNGMTNQEDWPDEIELGVNQVPEVPGPDPDELPPEEFNGPVLLLPGDIDPKTGKPVPCGVMILLFGADNEAWTTGARDGRFEFSRTDGYQMSWESDSEIIFDENSEKILAQSAIDEGLLSDNAIHALNSSAAAAANVNVMLDAIAQAPPGSPPSQATINGLFDAFGFPDCVDVDGDGFAESIDTDGDGIADRFDSDIDGDGTPNHEDSDADGDGELNAYDPTPYGGAAPGSGGGQGGGSDSDQDGILDSYADQYETDTGTGIWTPGDIGFPEFEIEGAASITTQDYTWDFVIPIPGQSVGATTFAMHSLPDTSTATGTAIDAIRIVVRTFIAVNIYIGFAMLVYRMLLQY